MKRWEYYSDHSVSLGRMNELGKKGWELIHVQRDNKTSYHWYYFKREIL